MSARRSPFARRGFTLVEVMVALTILSLVMLVTVTALRTLANTQIAVERQTLRIDEIRSVSSYLRDLFESAVVGRDYGGFTAGGGGRDAVRFTLGKDFLEFNAVVLMGENFGGQYTMRLAREAQSLVLRWREPGEYTRGFNWSDAPSRVVVEQLEEFSVATRRDVGAAWRDDDDSGVVPGHVRLRIKAGGRYWPDLVLRVQQ